VNFAISSLAMNFFEEYKVTVSSKSSGGEHDSTGLRAKQKLITPLLRCASPETATLYSELFETTQQNKKGSHRLPFLRFCVVENYVSETILGQLLLRLSLTRTAMRNLAVVVTAPRRMAVMVPVVGRSAICGLRRGRARCRQDRGNR
jgi:hypothetical protein